MIDDLRACGKVEKMEAIWNNATNLIGVGWVVGSLVKPCGWM
jgi:hypothetical protein